MNVFERSWEVTKATFSVMLHNKKMIWFAVADAVLSVLAFIPAIVIGLMLGGVVQGKGATSVLMLSILAAYFIAYFFTVFFDVAVVYTAKREFEKKHATTGEIISFTFKRMKSIIGWALINGSVGLILKSLKGRSRNGRSNPIGHLLSGLLSSAWSVLIIFVIPSIVYENKGPIKAVKTSFNTVRRTWGELLIRYFGLGLVQGGVVFVGLLVFSIVGFIGYDLGLVYIMAGAF
ncbi:MAG: DUF6159 family protein, partial [Nanoarchaeota archaeon]